MANLPTCSRRWSNAVSQPLRTSTGSTTRSLETPSVPTYPSHTDRSSEAARSSTSIVSFTAVGLAFSPAGPLVPSMRVLPRSPARNARTAASATAGGGGGGSATSRGGACRGPVRRESGRRTTTAPSTDSAAGASPILRRCSNTASTGACVAMTVGASRLARSEAVCRCARISSRIATSSDLMYAPAVPTSTFPCLRATSSIR